jgi:very-short-patch-repair endonuclease
MTSCERVLWDHLRDRRLAGLKFRRQHPIGPFIVDFYCAAARLVIEIDGAIHAYQQEKDALREKWLLERRFRVLRFTNRSVDREIGPVLHAIEAACLQASSRSIHEEGMDKAPGQVL